MKKYLPYILVLVVIVGILSPIMSINAQVGKALDAAAAAATLNPVSVAKTLVNFGDTEAAKSVGLSILSPSTWVPAALSAISWAVMKLTAFILGIGGLLLNFVVKYTIVDMSEKINAITGINITWKVVRDLMNIAFIFLLVYEGIKLIIGLGSREGIKKLIGGIVLASLLINFSLFFTKLIIDASNIVTVGFYNQILASGNSQNSLTGLSDAYQQALGLQGFFSGISVSAQNPYNSMTANIMASIFFIITAFVFFAISVLLVIRFVALVILLALSPIAYMGMALPSMQRYAKEWWDSLLGQVFFAPIFMIMSWIVIILIQNGITGALHSGDWLKLNDISDVGGTATAPMDLVFNFALIIGLTIASLVVSKKYATEGSKQIGTFSGKAMTFAGGAMVGGAAKAGKNTFGRGASWVSNNEWLKGKAFTTNENGELVARTGIGGFAARQSMKRSAQVAGSSFDARSTKAFGTLSETTGVSFGKGADKKKVNFEKDRENRAKAEAEFAKKFKPSDDATEKMKNERNKDGTGQGDLVDKAKQAAEVAGGVKTDADTVKNSIKEAKEKIDKLDKEEKALGESIKADITMEEETRIRGEMKIIQDKIKSEEKTLEGFDEALKEAMKKLGKANDAKSEADTAVSEGEAKIKRVFEDRVKAHAGLFTKESGSAMNRWSKNLAKIGFGGVIGAATSVASVGAGAVWGAAEGSSYARTAATNREFARKILALTKEKTPEQKIAEEARKQEKERRKKVKSGEVAPDDDDEDETPPATETPPTTT